jgi:hypothetical protein
VTAASSAWDRSSAPSRSVLYSSRSGMPISQGDPPASSICICYFIYDFTTYMLNHIDSDYKYGLAYKT